MRWKPALTLVLLLGACSGPDPPAERATSTVGESTFASEPAASAATTAPPISPSPPPTTTTTLVPTASTAPGATPDVGAAAPDTPAVAVNPPLPLPRLADPEVVETRGWLKGQLHLHVASADQRDRSTPRQMIERHEELGFDFVVVTDHNVMTTRIGYEGPVAVFRGAELEQAASRCAPQPWDPTMNCRIHVGALFVSDYGPETRAQVPFTGPAPDELMTWLVTQTLVADGEAMVNHPDVFWAVDEATLLTAWRLGARFIEMANQGPFGDWAPPDPDALDAEGLWDAILSQGALMYGVATDDAHAIDEIGFGWVMVWAEKTEESIREAMRAGEFYSSTGVTLTRNEVVDGFLLVSVDGTDPHRFRFIGRHGMVLDEMSGTSAFYRLDSLGYGEYVRVVVSAPDGTRAWTQPVGVLGWG